MGTGGLSQERVPIPLQLLVSESRDEILLRGEGLSHLIFHTLHNLSLKILEPTKTF